MAECANRYTAKRHPQDTSPIDSG